MIKKDNFKSVLEKLKFTKTKNIYSKKFKEFNTELKVDFDKELLIYPEKDGFTVNERQTCNFKQAENFVVFECVDRLLKQGYNPKHIELEPKWQVGHGASGGRADILVKDNSDNALLIIECKTVGSEFNKAWETTQVKPTQLFSYVQQIKSTKFIALYASDLVDDKVVASYYLINVYDNEKLLEHNSELKSYKDANTVEEIYQVWCDTYKKDYATIGLFEDTQAYDIGKDKYSVKDLKIVTSKDIQGKYHEFATIMRQHNVSGRENAFDKLVNLFLCKVVDEVNNPDELKFYWKGVAYDDPFSLQDRLNNLYKEGMKKFLGEDITYIENQQIDEAFSVFIDKPNMTKEIIQGFFKELKFFTNNDFAFVDVHNEELFYQNFEVLLKIVKMLQDIKLTGGEDNQFLGDMFEGFLDQGVKQSEGQFFTPMPIVKFIISSLPLDEIQAKHDNPKTIDYACGAGHFLNEVAKHLPQELHKNILGIEKEYRLSKVAKVSSFMYGQDDIQIVYNDALANIDTVKKNDYSVLVANPPYSVKGFLETLSEKERKQYDLLSSIDEKSYPVSNSIECFFVERAKQLLKEDAVAGIILPSSILSKGSQKIASSKGNIYVHTREIILKYFDIIAITEFGSGTFGKTGTNTVTLFLQRRSSNPDIAKHLDYMVKSWFEGDFTTNEHFKDKDLLENYCKYLDIDLELYKKLLQNILDNVLFEIEVFSEYKLEFEKLTETKKRKKRKSYKALSAEMKKVKESKELIKYIKLIEIDKLYYFCLAYLNKKEVLIIKAPAANTKNKKFIGYEWSGRKGDEGIKYITSAKTVILDDEENEGDTEVLENILNLNNIQTPLYNPNNISDKNKINTLIANNFNYSIVDIPEALEEFASKARLVDMLDFAKKEFSKAISLNPKRKVKIIGKPEWQVKLGDVTNVLIGGTPSRKNSDYFTGNNLWVSISEMNGQVINNTKEKISDDGIKKSNVKLIPKGTTLLSFKLSIGKTAIAGKDLYTNEAIAGLIPRNKNLLDKYLFTLFDSKIIDLEKDGFNTFGKSLNSTFLKSEVKFPLPPLDIQKEIIKACEIIDTETEKAKEEIESIKSEIDDEIKSVGGNMVKLIDITSKIGSGATPKGGESSYKESGISLIRSQNIYDDGFHTKGLAFIDDAQAKKLDIVTVQENDVLFNITGASVARCCVVETIYLPARVNQHVSIIRPTEKVESKYLQKILTSQKIKNSLLTIAKQSSTREAITKTQLENFKIPLPTLKIQKIIISKIQKFEDEITIAKMTVESASKMKQDILKKYL